MAEVFTIVGRIYKQLPIETFETKEGKEMKKSAVIIQQDKEKSNGEAFSIHPKFEMFNRDAEDLHNNFEVGDKVEVEFILVGRLYNSKKTKKEDSFTGLKAWNITKLPEEAEPKAEAPVAEPPADNGDKDELPF